MKAYLEYIPLLIFFIVYKLPQRVIQLASFDIPIGGIYSATAALMLSTVIVFGIVYAQQRQLSKLQWLVVGAVLVFGSSTLLLRSEAILKWKAPVVNWILAAIFLGSHFMNPSNNMAKTMFGELVKMPDAKWTRLNFAWALVFFGVGCANLFVAFNFHEWWVDFKVFGSLGLLLLASLAQIVYIYPYLDKDQPPDRDDKSGINSRD